MTDTPDNTFITPPQFHAHPWPEPSFALRQRILAQVQKKPVQALLLPFGLSSRGAGLFLSSLLLVGFLSGTVVGLATPALSVASPASSQSLSYHSTGAALMAQLYSPEGDER